MMAYLMEVLSRRNTFAMTIRGQKFEHQGHKTIFLQTFFLEKLVDADAHAQYPWNATQYTVDYLYTQYTVCQCCSTFSLKQNLLQQFWLLTEHMGDGRSQEFVLGWGHS